MSVSYYHRVECYLLALKQAKKLLSLGILSPSDYKRIDTILADKYALSSSSIYRLHDLINT